MKSNVARRTFTVAIVDRLPGVPYTRRVRRIVVVVMLLAVGCGRIGFDPSTGTGPTDGPANGDGSDGMSSIDAAPPDATVTACTAAIPLIVGQRAATSTCASGTDLLDGCGPPGTQEVVFEFVAPATGAYQVAAYNPGNSSINNSTSVVTAGCTSTDNSCTGIAGTGYVAGQVTYFVVEADAGGCANIEFLVN